MKVTKEHFEKKTANTSDDARLDIRAPNFWQKGQVAYFDVRVTHVNCPSQQDQETKRTFKAHEMAKKREYMDRILQVDNGSFTPLVFGTNGGLGEECQQFLQTLASKITAKDDEKYAQTISWIRTRISFEIIRSSLACVRGSRIPYRGRVEELQDFELMSIRGCTSEV